MTYTFTTQTTHPLPYPHPKIRNYHLARSPAKFYLYSKVDLNINNSTKFAFVFYHFFSRERYSNLFYHFISERKGASAVMHCNGKLPSLASLIYSGSEFKMKNQGIIKVSINFSIKYVVIRTKKFVVRLKYNNFI